MKISNPKWRGFLQHLGPYVIVISILAMINLLTSSYPWFLWHALGWGIGLALHLWGILLSGDKSQARAERHTPRERSEPQQRPAQRPATATKAHYHLANNTIQAHLDKARAYKEQINSMIGATSNEVASTRLQNLARQVDEWTQAIEDLAWRVDRFQQNTLIHQDLESVPKYIEELEARLANETNEATRTELERTLTNRKNQLAALENLQKTMKRAEIKIESTLSALGTIYPQLLTSQSTNHVADYTRLSADVDEEVRTLQDHLEALEEVKFGRV